MSDAEKAAAKAAMAITAGKRLVAVLGREVTVQWPTPGDLFTIEERMYAVAQRWCVSPLAYVHSQPEAALAGADRVNAIAIAIEKGSGGGVTPSGMAVARAYNSVEGLRYRLWRLTRRTMPDLNEEQIATLVTEDNRPDLIDALDNMLKALDPNS